MDQPTEYRVIVTEHYYEDNFEQGEVDGTYGWNDIEDRDFPTLEKAIAWVKDKWYRPGDDAGTQIEDSKVLLSSRMMKVKDGVPVEPTDADIEAWKAGKINLWSDEYQAAFYEVKPVSVDRLDKALDAAGI